MSFVTRSSLLNKARVALSQEENKDKVELVLTSGLILFTLLVFFLPLVNTLNSKIVQNQNLKAEKEVLDKKLADFKKISEYYDEISIYKSAVEKKVPINPDPSSTLETINKLSVNSNLSFKSTTLLNKIDGVESYSVNFSGSFDNVYSFFQKVNTDERYIKIWDLNLITDSVENNLTMKINLSTYYHEK